MELADRFAEAERRLRALVEAALRSGSEADRRGALRAAVALLRLLSARTLDHALAAVRSAYRTAVRAADALLTVAPAGLPVAGDLHRRAELGIARDLAALLGGASAFAGERTRAVLGAPPPAEADLAEAVTDATTGLVDRAGKRWPLGVYAEMAVHRATATAGSRGTINRIFEVGGDLVEVSTTGSGNPICEPYEGGIFSLSGEDPTYPELEAAPPYHARCGHELSPA